MEFETEIEDQLHRAIKCLGPQFLSIILIQRNLEYLIYEVKQATSVWILYWYKGKQERCFISK
jgi:hypothetical protein